jgi:hypothetical protein
MKFREEYSNDNDTRRRDWLVFGASLVFALVLLVFIPEWIWVSFPFVFTALAGAMGRL